MQLHQVEKRLNTTIAAAAKDGYDASGVLSGKTEDRVKDTMDEGVYQPFIGKRIPALFAHDHEKIVGVWENLREEGGKLVGDLRLAATDLGKYIKALIEANVPLMNSIGFRAKGTPNKSGGMHFTSIDIFEASVCAVGAHPDAVMIAKQFNIELPATPVQGESDLSVVSDASALSIDRAKAAILAANRTLRIKS
jgi:HK97 family phage prohead protease